MLGLKWQNSLRLEIHPRIFVDSFYLFCTLPRKTDIGGLRSGGAMDFSYILWLELFLFQTTVGNPYFRI